LLSDDYIEYSYNNASAQLSRSLVDDGGSVLKNWVFYNITEAPFYSAVGVPLEAGDILSSKKLVVVIAAENKIRNNLILNYNLTEEVKVRNE
ncbi:MAG: hypothetical protein JW788_04045, partial [Candidatus Omnitrophica bacterium]|nr:hypothetical protein [Candidatus Omnitrophota bacterium]